MRKVVRIENLDFGYNSEYILRGVSFSAEDGDYIGIVGPNGSGKTTLLKLILGFYRPKNGIVEVFGKTPSELKDRRVLGYLPQTHPEKSVNFPVTVKEVILMGLNSNRLFFSAKDRDYKRKLREALEIFGIRSLENKLIGELSPGQRQKVFLLRALIHDPKLLLLDEPVAALDPESREEFYRILNVLNSERRTTILMVTHDVGEIGNYAKKLLYLDRRVIFFGSFEEFCKSKEMTEYFGEFSQHIICHRHDRSSL